MRIRTLVAVLFLVVAACGGTADGPLEGTSTTSDVTTTVAATTTKGVTTAAPTVTTEAPAPEPLAIPRLDSGLPATFVAVTEGWEAVEVDTATGATIRTIGRSQSPVEAENEAGMAGAIQQVWRTSDRQWVIVSECCEPAAGIMYFVGPGDVLTADNQMDSPFTFGWTAAPSPFNGDIANAGYTMEVGSPTAPSIISVPLDQPGGPGYPSGVAAWDRSGKGISWLTEFWTDVATLKLAHLDLTDTNPTPTVIDLDWIEPNQWLDGMGTQESGNHVAFLNTTDLDPESPEVVATEGVVFTPAGELVATFTVETGARWGGYDPTGKLLIYTDADGAVRWRGRGQSGVLAEGFIHASW